MPAIEEQRLLHEDLERLEQAISDRILEEPRNIRERLNRDHEIAGFLGKIQDQSKRLIDVYNDADGSRGRELQSLATGDPFAEFYKQLGSIKEYHRQYPNVPIDNLERAYRRKMPVAEGETPVYAIDNMFTGEEAFGRYFDLTGFHEQYLNLPGIRGGRRLTYLQYLDVFDHFTPPHNPMKRTEKTRDEYFTYVTSLATYLEDFMRKIKPLEDLDKLFATFDKDFMAAWEADSVPGWSKTESNIAGPAAAPTAEGTGEGIWCADCEKEFKNDNVYKNHLTGKKHIRAAEAKKGSTNGSSNGTGGDSSARVQRLKERAVAEREFRVRKLCSSMQTERSATRENVERRQGMTDRERKMEIEALYAEANEQLGQPREDEEEGDGEDRIYNPLKLPLAWDGKPIPFWLYKLHGLGVEFPCELCGNYVYMGRRAFDKHFNESRHVYGLKALGITNTTLFREITKIEEALKLHQKLESDKKKEKTSTENVVQMEDSQGNVMPEAVYRDLEKQGLL